MGKETDLLKAVKSKDLPKVQRLLSNTSGKKHVQDIQWKNASMSHVVLRQLSHINVNVLEKETLYTPLHLSVLAGSKDITELLLFYSANVLAQDVKGNTPLHLAVFGGRSDIIDLLLGNGADVNIVNADQNTPLHIATQNNSKLHIFTKLIEAGANVIIENKDHHTPLDIAATYNRKEVVSALLDRFPELSANQCAIVEAAMRDNADVVELLLEYGVNPNQLDTVHGSTALHEAVRFNRPKSTEILLSFGANMVKENLNKETPSSLIKDLPAAVQERFQNLFVEYASYQYRTPKFLPQNQSSFDFFKLKFIKDYPLLPTQSSWTQNTHEFCSSCTEANPNIHIVDDNPTTFWVIPEMHDAWTTLDLGSPHIITGITVLGWDSPQMICNFQLQAGETLRGPWFTFTAHACQRLGSTNPKDPGVGQTFKGFTVKLRYLRIYVVDNHDGSCICFQGVRLHGADYRIFEILESCHLPDCLDSLVLKGVNTYRKLLDLKKQDITDFVLTTLGQNSHSLQKVKDPNLVPVLFHAILEERRKLFPMTQLEWLRPPLTDVNSGAKLPEFSVQSNPEVSEEIQIIVEGAEVVGETQVQLCPMGENLPSVATFNNIQIKTVGKYQIKAKGILTDIEITAPEEIIVRPPRLSTSEISTAFDEIQIMLSSLQESI